MNPSSKNLKLQCPRCHRPVVWENNPNRPFCSEKCRLVDLGCWADEAYRIAGDKANIDNDSRVIDFPKDSFSD